MARFEEIACSDTEAAGLAYSKVAYAAPEMATCADWYADSNRTTRVVVASRRKCLVRRDGRDEPMAAHGIGGMVHSQLPGIRGRAIGLDVRRPLLIREAVDQAVIRRRAQTGSSTYIGPGPCAAGTRPFWWGIGRPASSSQTIGRTSWGDGGFAERDADPRRAKVLRTEVMTAMSAPRLLQTRSVLAPTREAARKTIDEIDEAGVS